MNAHQRRKERRLYEQVFGTHVDYYFQIPIKPVAGSDTLVVPAGEYTITATVRIESAAPTAAESEPPP